MHRVYLKDIIKAKLKFQDPPQYYDDIIMSEISESVQTSSQHSVFQSDNPPDTTAEDTSPNIDQPIIPSVPLVAGSRQSSVDEETSSEIVVDSTDPPTVESEIMTSQDPEKLATSSVDKSSRPISDPRTSINGIALRTRFRSSIALALNFTAAIVLTALTIAVASTSFSHALIYNPPFLPYDPQFAILLL